MAIKLSVLLTEGQAQPLSELTFDKDKVAIGRAPESEVLLVDTEGHVSRTHAVILRDGSGYEVMDFGSRNGTYLNGKRLEPSARSAIVTGDAVRVGPYTLRIDSTSADSAKAVMQSKLIYHDSIARRAAEIEPRLIMEGNAPTAAKEPLPELDEHEGTPKRPTAKVISGEIAGAQRPTTKVPEATPEAKRPTTEVRSDLPTGKTDAVAADGVDALVNASYKVMTRLSDHFLGESAFATPEQVDLFGRLIEQTLETTLDWLVKCLKGRGEFEEQFEAYVTMAFKRTNNPIKQVRDQMEIRRYPLDWRGTPDMEKVRHSLEGAFRDLGEHQMGMIAGVQEAVQAILRRIDPETLEHQAVANAKGLGKTFAKLSLAKRAWRIYSQTYRELLAESTKLFNDVIFPSIRRGYLESHSRESGQPAANAQPK